MSRTSMYVVRLRITLSLAGLALVAACGDGTTEPPPPDPPRASTVTVTPATAELTALGATVLFSAQVLDQYGNAMEGEAVAWSSGDANVATVDAAGLATAAGNGTATVTATSGSASGSASLTVAQVASAVEVAPSAETLAALGDTVRFSAQVLDENGNAMEGEAVAWSSGDANVATVDAAGLATAAGNGTATVTATSGSASGSASLTVAQVASAVEVAPSAETLAALGDTVRFSAEATDANGHAVAGAEFAWSSSEALVATVDGSGLATAAGNGTATITATAGSASGSAAVEVMQMASAVEVAPSAETLAALGDTVRFSAEATDANGHAVAGAEFAWSSSEALVATVDGSGLATAAGNGTATITATAGSASGSAAVEVMQMASAVEVAPSAETLAALGDTVRFSAEATDANGHAVAGAEFAWSSSEALVATVDGSGLATAAGNGTATITATAGSASGSAAVAVTQVASAVEVAPSAETLAALGDTVRFSAEATDANGHAVAGAEFAWSSSDALVATVDGSGLATAASNGTATITATAGSASGSAAVAVMQVASAVEVAPSADTLAALGDTVRFSAEATDANGHAVAGAEFAWSSSEAPVATVDGSGLVTAAGNGTATITATAGSASGSAAVAVIQVASAVEVAPSADTLAALGDTVRFSAEATDANGHAVAGAEFAWSSSEAPVATVDGSGLVTAAGNGTATITATAGSASGSAAVEVMQTVAGMAVSPASDTLAPGETLRLLAEALDANGHAVAGTEFAWSSSDRFVATVDEAGLVRGLRKEGTATITATTVGEEARATSEIAVVNPDRAVLVALYEATDGPHWVNSENWLTDAPLGDWYGVGTNAFGRVDELGLFGLYDREERRYILQGLKGPIPAELGNLTNLETLNLSYNELTGPIPAELGNFVGLESLFLNNNELTGPIPAELGNLSNLTLLYLNNNELTGPIPAELGNLSNLTLLNLSYNELTGPIPAELGNLSNLTWLYLYNNELTGPIPAELGNLSKLTWLFLNNNELTGPIPAELGNLSKLSRQPLL